MYTFKSQSITKPCDIFYSNQQLDSVQLTEVYHNEGPNGETKYQPEDLYRIKYESPDSAIINLYEYEDRYLFEGNPIAQWRVIMHPDYLGITYFHNISANPLYVSVEYKRPYVLVKSNNREVLNDCYRDVYAFNNGDNYSDKIRLILNENGQIIEGNHTDIIKEYFVKHPKNRMEYYTKILKNYNSQGDVSQILVKHYRFNYTKKEYQVERTDTIENEYKYDNQGNWIYRKQRSQRNRDEQVTYEVRKIIYYDTPEYDEKIAREKEIENNRIYTKVDYGAEFPGGYMAQQQWISNAEYKLDNPGSNRSYTVYAIVEKDGSLTNLSVDELRTEDYIKEELLRIVRLMPPFKPAYSKENR